MNLWYRRGLVLSYHSYLSHDYSIEFIDTGTEIFEFEYKFQVSVQTLVKKNYKVLKI
jgi:hypothetical protein